MRLGTRGSALALAQAHWVRELLAAAGQECSLVEITTTGDRDRAVPDKLKWVKELDEALLDGRIDIAVHSAKDVPSLLPDGLALVATPPREDPRDALIGALGPRVGTASPRRAAQLRASAPEVEVREVRGNVDTRLAKLAAGEYDGIVLAVAGLKRLGREAEISEVLDLVPAAGQGTVVLAARAGYIVPDGLNDPATWTALCAERACVAALEADCHTAVGAHWDGTRFRAWVGAEDGSAWLQDELAVAGTTEEPEALGALLAERLLSAGANAVLGR
ncbi:MAG: porphobilinogen deaminase [Solirubrobacterales bacterium]|nr:porphobilinogen deaminase [Solirubrobacterales bacterium]